MRLDEDEAEWFAMGVLVTREGKSKSGLSLPRREREIMLLNTKTNERGTGNKPEEDGFNSLVSSGNVFCNPSPSLAQLKDLNTFLSLSATGDAMFAGGKR